MNVLLTSAGRRNYLLRYFRSALDGRGKILAADASRDAPALAEADQAFLVPSVSSPAYVDELLDLCRAHDVRLLIPLNDLELPVLAPHRDRFLGIGAIPVVSSPDVVRICMDKWETVQFLRTTGLRGPKTWLALEDAQEALRCGEVRFPLIVKPRFGTASILTEMVMNPEELALASRMVEIRIERSIIAEFRAKDGGTVLFQEGLQGQEYGLDVVNDLAGNHLVSFARAKLAMRAGETDRAVTVDRADLAEMGRALGSALRHVGNLDCDAFVQGGTCTILEMNPRIGGGYPFSHVAGVDLAATMIASARGEELRPEWLRIEPGVRVAKCDRLVRLRGETASRG